uniref:Pro-opiomelanocortin/corticotropin ACTH central region domain-containing protein n=2 Tax=Scophthalmus maximus TaxID=52904 RepID=A0A8D3AQ49_SCOMX
MSQSNYSAPSLTLVSDLCSRMRMSCLRWLLMAAVACVCVPGLESVCWNSSTCNNLSNEQRIRDCIRLCIPKIQEELRQLSALAQKVDDSDLVLSILLAILSSSEDRMSESGPSHSDERRSYSMEHFRWGKPPGRKRRPVKVFASSLEGGGSSEGSFPLKVRRQLGMKEGEVKRDLNSETQQNQGLQRERVSSKAQVPSSPQDRKGGAYRMSHFRWGNPLTSKRDGNFAKLLGEKPKGQLANLFRNIIWDEWRRTPEGI